MAASRLLGAAAAWVMLLSFAAGHRKSYWDGCVKAALLICHEIFSHLALAIFLLKFVVVFLLWRRGPVLELQSVAVVRSSFVFCN